MSAGRPGPWLRFAANRLALAGLAVLIAILFLALAAPLLPLPHPDLTDPPRRLLPLFAEGHILGTDHLGRDLLSRLLHGTRASLAVGLLAMLAAGLTGSAIGLIAGYRGGMTDNAMMRGIDIVMGFPYILLALAIVAVLGPGLMNALYAIAIVNIPFFARTVRGVTVGLTRRDFIDAARLAGKGHMSILLTELLPNVLPTIVVTMSTTLGWMILETAGLSFLGLGAQPPAADLGSMLGEGRKLLFTAPHVSVVPGLMIFLLVMSLNLVGDGVRDLLDPRLATGGLARPSARTAVDPERPRPTAPVADAVLDVGGLRTHFVTGNRVLHAVDGVDLALRAGECLGVVGESGSGKSVTALSLAGLVPTPPGRIVAGRVMHGGEDLLDVPFERLRRIRGGAIAYVFQDPLSSLHPLMTIGDQIVEGLRAHGSASRAESRSRAVELLRLVRIPNPDRRFEAWPHELSGGMRQRVAFAMALANEPGIVIADEPTTALDVTVQARILALVNRLRRERGMAVLFITHDIGVVAALCDHVTVMYAGRIVEAGPTKAVLNSPMHPYTRGLIDCVPVLGKGRGAFDTIAGQPPMPDALPDGCAFAPRCSRAQEDCRHGHIALAPFGDGRSRSVRCLHPLEETPV